MPLCVILICACTIVHRYLCVISLFGHISPTPSPFPYIFPNLGIPLTKSATINPTIIQLCFQKWEIRKTPLCDEKEIRRPMKDSPLFHANEEIRVNDTRK
uniref:Secreted protein n=1 Tax=Cacopsylla melanoneura TaxID=428564 RepID=A0A8D8ZVV0_9HEMI